MSTPKLEAAEAKSHDTDADRLQELAAQSTALARLVARNESATPELLEKLSHHSDTTVRKWVCAHANTPTEVLGRLGGQFPQQLLENPVLDFMILENPNLLRELPQAAKTSMLKRQTCPASFIELMAQDMDWEEGMQMAITMNPNTPENVIQKLQKSYYDNVKDAARQHIHASGSRKNDAALQAAVSKTLREQFDANRVFPWAAIKNMEQVGVAEREIISSVLMKDLMTDANVVNPHTAIERVVELLPRASLKVRMSMARRSNATSAVLQQLSLDKSTSVREIVAKIPKLPSEIVEKLAYDKNASIRKIVAEIPNLPSEIVQQLAYDKSASVREIVVDNQSIQLETLQLLAQDKQSRVRAAVARNTSTPVEVLQLLAQDKKMRVRWDVAGDTSTPSEDLHQLAQDKKKWVRRTVAGNTSTPIEALQQLAQDNLRLIRAAVARNESTPVETLQQLTQDNATGWRQNSEVLWSVVNNSVSPHIIEMAHSSVKKVALSLHTPAEILMLLAKYKDDDVRSAVAGNPNTSVEVLQQLAEEVKKHYWGDYPEHVIDTSRLKPAPGGGFYLTWKEEDYLDQSGSQWDSLEVLAKIAGNPNAPVEVLKQFAKDFESMEGDRYEGIQDAILGNPNTPIVLREKMFQSMDRWRRERVAENPSTPITLLQQLAKDGCSFVSNSAENNFLNTPVATLQQLAKDGDEYVRQNVAMHPNTPAETLQRLAMDKKSEVRENVAEHPNTPAETLVDLIKDKDKDVAGKAVSNPNCPPLLQPDEYAPFLASLPFLPMKSYKPYAYHADPTVRAALANNPLAPTELLKNLADDSDVDVRLALAKNCWVDPAIHVLQSNDAVSKIRAAVARQPRLPHAQQFALAADDQPTVRASLARNKNCSAELLSQLAADEKFSVRKAVAVSPQLTTELIRQLSGDDVAMVRESVWKRTDLEQKVREQLDQEFGAQPVKKAKSKSAVKSVKSGKPLKAKKIVEPDTSILTTIGKFSQKSEYTKLSAHLIKLYQTLPYEQRGKLLDFMSAESKRALPGAFANHYAATFAKGVRPSFNRLLALMLNECPTPIIAKAVRSNDWLERLAIATHPKAPANTLKILCNDGNKWVRQAAERVVQQQEKAA